MLTQQTTSSYKIDLGTIFSQVINYLILFAPMNNQPSIFLLKCSFQLLDEWGKAEMLYLTHYASSKMPRERGRGTSQPMKNVSTKVRPNQ